MALEALGVLVLLGMLAGFVLFLVALIDLIRRPADAWKASGQSQLIWALIVIFVGVIGPVLYLLIARPQLEKASGLTPNPAG